MSGTESTSRPSAFQSIKITDTHRAKLAVVYVRQSSPQQVVENRESLARQYSLADYARALGWPADRVLVIDEDLGQSGRTADARLGFQRLLAEVTLDHVGMVLGLERTGTTCWRCAVSSVLYWPTRTESTTLPTRTTDSSSA